MIQLTNRPQNILHSILLVAVLVVFAQAQQHRQGHMGGNHQQDMQTIHAEFVETFNTTSPKVQALIKEHAWAMKARLKNHAPIRRWDPLFAAIFENADKISLEVTNTPKGVKVVETSSDPYVVKLIQAHAASISEHVKEGPSSMPKRHELPGISPDGQPHGMD